MKTHPLENGGKTGHPPGLLQDDCRKLSKWLASRMNARQEVREACKLIAQEKTMNNKTDQRGFFDFNVTGFIIGCLIVGAAIGIAIAYLVPWLWSFIKPLIHALTA